MRVRGCARPHVMPRPSADVDRTAAPRESPEPATYRRLLRVRGLLPLLLSSLLTRTATQMWTVGIVLFTLERYHSPSVAGISIFVLIFPGLTVSPIAGALLDRHGRKRLMRLDFTVAATCLTTIVTLAATNHLPVWGLLLLLGFGSLTSTLSNAGARSLYPLIIPTRPVGPRQCRGQHHLRHRRDPRPGPRRHAHRGLRQRGRPRGRRRRIRRRRGGAAGGARARAHRQGVGAHPHRGVAGPPLRRDQRAPCGGSRSRCPSSTSGGA